MIINTEEKMEQRRNYYRQKLIDSFSRKYYESGEKKWLHHLSKLGVDVDYTEADMDGPKGYNQ